MTGTVIGIVIGILTAATLLTAVGLDPLRRLLAYFFPSLDPDHFACRILKLEEETETGYTDLLKIQIQGRIRAPRNHCDTDLHVRLMDVTESGREPKPVLCKRAEWSADGRCASEYTLYNGTLPARISALADWVTVIELRSTDLIFPRRGPSELACILSILDKESGKPLASARGQTNLISESRGYEEIQQQRHTKQTATLQLAACIWDRSGRSPEGKDILEQWVSQQIFETEPSLEDLLASCRNSPEPWMEQACDGLLGWADPADRYSAVELCLKIAAAGRSIHKDLLSYLHTIADKLEIPEDRFQTLSQKYLTGRVAHMEDPRVLLGLTEQMTEDQIRRQLTAEYRKWNARVTHPDPAVRQQADQMLNLIAQFRSQYAHRV